MLAGPGLPALIANALATVGSHDERSAAARAVVLVGELAYLGGLAARLGRELRPSRGAGECCKTTMIRVHTHQQLTL